ncbi:uncharacterized protein LOC129645921 isoform X17 [Bubalus kerabau]|uniref:uncharacterized protein LOC129645921 isoform X17 n=1 Tax=Bubalus carabanensis TaxID=3119969 RepID=UPI00244EEA0B|nr:uncharacterized protein LOC129645921 isoform X17 [Bubalus carabanensis]
MDEHIAITVLDRLPLFPVSCYEERYSADFVCLQRITSTVTCRPHLAPRLSAAREGVSSSPLPSESWCWILSLWTVFAAVSVGRGNRYACPVQKACDDLNHRKQLYLPGTWLDGQPVSPPALIDP